MKAYKTIWIPAVAVLVVGLAAGGRALVNGAEVVPPSVDVPAESVQFGTCDSECTH